MVPNQAINQAKHATNGPNAQGKSMEHWTTLSKTKHGMKGMTKNRVLGH